MDAGADALLALEVNAPTEFGRSGRHAVQPDAVSAGLGGEERVENVRLEFRRYPETRIGYRQAHEGLHGIVTACPGATTAVAVSIVRMPTAGIASEAFSTRLSRTRSRSSWLARIRHRPRVVERQRQDDSTSHGSPEGGSHLVDESVDVSHSHTPVELAPTIEPLREMLIARPSR